MFQIDIFLNIYRIIYEGSILEKNIATGGVTMIGKQLFMYIFMGLLCVPAINAMDRDGNNAAEKFWLVKHALEKQGLPKDIRYLIEEVSLTNEIKEATILLKRMDLSPYMGSSERIQMMSKIYFLDEKRNKGLRHLLLTHKGKYLSSELSSDEFEQIKSIPSSLLRHASPCQTVEEFSQDFYEVPRDVLHQEERRSGLLRIAGSPILGGCVGGVCAFLALGSSLLEGKGVISKNDAIFAIAILAASAEAFAVIDYLEMEYKYLSREKIPSIYRKKKITPTMDPFKKWRSTGTDFKDYANSQKYKNWQRSVALTE